MTQPITITHSTQADVSSVSRLAQLDSRRAPEGPTLLAHVDGELRAAVGVSDGQVVADPFHQTADIVQMLRLRAQQEGDRGMAA